MEELNLQDIRNAVDQLPEKAAQAVIEKLGDSPLGMTLSDGNKLRDYLATLSPDGMSIMAERLVEADKAMGHELLHRPHFESFIRVVNATAENADDEMDFYKKMSTIIPALPAENAMTGEPVASHKLYEQTADPKYSVLAQAREALRNDDTDAETAMYWWERVFDIQPELRGQGHITADDILMDDQEKEAFIGADLHNFSLGKSAGRLLDSLGYGNKSGQPSSNGVLTLEEAQSYVEEEEARTDVLRAGSWHEDSEAVEGSDNGEVTTNG
ncbi:hypothetical protein OAI08_05865 [Gammaproteobacteria bacterium]|nr:hypothetical protein [Gammaproteobacteria bacterium]